MKTHKVWMCKIGVVGDLKLPPGADGPMRTAIERAFREITGRDAEFTFSGWGGELTEGEKLVVDKRPSSKGLRRRRRLCERQPIVTHARGCFRSDGDWLCAGNCTHDRDEARARVASEHAIMRRVLTEIAGGHANPSAHAQSTLSSLDTEKEGS